MNGQDKLQAFVAVGKIIDDKAYQVEQFEGFFPFRRKCRVLSTSQRLFHRNS